MTFFSILLTLTKKKEKEKINQMSSFLPTNLYAIFFNNKLVYSQND